MDEFIDQLLREERMCDVILPRIQRRQVSRTAVSWTMVWRRTTLIDDGLETDDCLMDDGLETDDCLIDDGLETDV